MASTDLRTAAQQALEALEAGPDVDPIVAGETADVLRAALAEPVQEPVATLTVREDIIRMAREAGLKVCTNISGVTLVGAPLGDTPSIAHITIDEMERFAALVAAAERKAWPRLDPVISWLENGCDPKEAAKELRVYEAAIRARGQA